MRCKITSFYLYMVNKRHETALLLTYFLFYYDKRPVILYQRTGLLPIILRIFDFDYVFVLYTHARQKTNEFVVLLSTYSYI